MSIAVTAPRGETALARPAPEALVPRRGWPRLAAAAVSAVLGAATAAVLVVQSVTGLPANTALKVDGQVVTVSALQHRIAVLSTLYGVQPPSGGSALKTFDQLAAKSEALTLIIQDAARKDHVTANPAAANNALNQLIQQDFPDGRQAFLEALSAKGVSQADVLSEVTLQLQTGQLYDKVTAGVPNPGAVAVQQAVKARAATAFAPEQRHLRNIVVKSRAQAADVLRQAKAGASFSSLAARYSLDNSTKSQGGDIGTVAASQLDPGYARPAFAASSGGFFGPVHDQYGWNVGQVVSIRPGQQYSASQIQSNLTQNAKDSAWNAWLTQQMKNAAPRYAKAYQPASPYSVAGATQP